MLDVNKKWALITGSSRGIGSLIALFMAQQGCNLVLHSRSLSHTKKIMQQVKALGVQVYNVKADLANHLEVVGMLDEIEARGTLIDIVFNNAAVQVPYRDDFWNTPVEDFELSFRVNFIAVTAICYRLIPKMINRGVGRVVNITSGIMHQPEQAAYSASKAALDKFSKDLGNRLQGTDVLINLADPGWCRTDLGGPLAPNSPQDSIPAVVLGAFMNDARSGRLFEASFFRGMSLQEAVEKAESLSVL